ncbi:MAG: hypothetical protein GF364_21255 [Candidatus Lokiarchaeota archaeon]|nr:hypothetical protein [Candidatus Lokiarchaeota archaeon]
MFEIIYHPLYGELNEIELPKPYFESYESPLRCKLVWEYLKKIGYALRDFKRTEMQTNSQKNLVLKKPIPLKKDDLYLVHSKHHVEQVEKFTEDGCGQLGNLVRATEDTMEIALLSAGGAYEAIKDVYSKRNTQAFAIIRPPGHHAIPDAADGLCVFNNIALAIKKLRKELAFKGRIAIVDIDAHYGNGIANVFYEDPSVLYSSIHEFDFSMGDWGRFSEIGIGDGLGCNISFPVRLNSGDEAIKKYCDFVEPFLVKYSPAIIIVAAGFDGHWADPLGNLRYTSDGYRYFAQWLKKIARTICSDRVCFCLEGGYNLLMLPRLIETIISEFINIKCSPPVDKIPYKSIFGYGSTSEYIDKHYNSQVDKIRKRLNRIWKLMH